MKPSVRTLLKVNGNVRAVVVERQAQHIFLQLKTTIHAERLAIASRAPRKLIASSSIGLRAVAALSIPFLASTSFDVLLLDGFVLRC